MISSSSPVYHHSSEPPPRNGLLISCGVGTILLACAVFGVGATMLGSRSDDRLSLLGFLMIPLSLVIGLVSIQFFLALSRNPTGCCKVCGCAKPTLRGSLHRHVGAIILMFHTHISGYLCKDCIGQVFWQFTPITLAGGWWGIISFFVTPVVILNNFAYYARSRLAK